MASIDWQTQLTTTLGLVSTSLVYLFTGLYWALSWIALNVVAHTPGFIYKIVTILAKPLTYPLYYVWRTVTFLLSPFWALGWIVTEIMGWIIAFVARHKVRDILIVYWKQERKRKEGQKKKKREREYACVLTDLLP